MKIQMYYSDYLYGADKNPVTVDIRVIKLLEYLEKKEFNSIQLAGNVSTAELDKFFGEDSYPIVYEALDLYVIHGDIVGERSYEFIGIRNEGMKMLAYYRAQTKTTNRFKRAAKAFKENALSWLKLK